MNYLIHLRAIERNIADDLAEIDLILPMDDDFDDIELLTADRFDAEDFE